MSEQQYYPAELYDDDRPIKSISLAGAAFPFAAPRGGKIVSYREAGYGGYVGWFAFYDGRGVLYRRVNSACVDVVEYEPTERE